ncbi:MAG: AAA family ATPase [Okeania sp. SIO3I5]|uniref:trifunctional serine/threonine-protein kinase/ATP-binding protein/sensor histidine kinase n=1 Tax=Okeania sp. SIO3I5 TaxID=2607805 RepID=UPI0013BA5EEA|nr:AAA family ATPase [Okeania sp. SIO3I5]NEQ40980.1 AAA family ATPase [Okeania sp. SIO3I5]
MIEKKTITIDNYETLELIHESERTLVYRARNLDSGQPVIIKLIAQEYPSFNELVQFRNQYAIAKNLDIPGIVKAYSLLPCKNGYALIMEDIGGISLAEYQRLFSVSIEQFWEISLSLAEILHHLHQNQIIHKDIKPANILIHPESKQVKLIDFSISSLLPKERTSLQTPNVLEGTLVYISPEQTGRMNRGIDYRSDFYSLGVTFYELLTGKLPFESEDPLELVHAHIAKTPTLISDAQVPKLLADIVMKLMAKNAEQRYQSALGLQHDLEKCRVEYEETGKIEPFVLGERDLCDRFLIPEKLYGREKEVQTLLDAFERVVSPLTPLGKGGRAEMILVAGYSGIGKTAVVNEVHKPITRQKGYFIKGKFDQFNRNIPFSAFVEAFRDLMVQLLGESDLELANWKGKILEAVGENGQVLIDVIPELQHIIGQQPPVPELSGNAAQNRFNLLFEKFIAVFTSKEHPLTLFLDDLQWADSASLNLLKVLMGETQTGYLLLLGAYRDNEVFPAHPLMLTLGELEKENTTISTITLAPLSVPHINQLVAETLSCSVELAAPLTDLVYQKTKGNPFFTTQFLKGLYEDELITFNQDFGYWECDLVKVRETALTDDVVEFMAGRLHKLPEATQKVLKLAACIGNQFDLETLGIICEIPAEEVAADLWSALREGLILPKSEAYKFFQGWKKEEDNAEGITVDYRFLHDRVQQAAYSLIATGEEKVTHLNIGKLLLEKTSNDQQENKLFDIVNHLNIGIELVTSPRERYALVLLNLRASQKAKTSTAYIAASRYLAIAMDLLPENSWEIQYDLTLKLHEERAEIEDLKGDFTASRKYIEAIIAFAKKDLEKARIYKLLIVQYAATADFEASIQAGMTGLKLLGIDFPQQNLSEAIEQEYSLAQKTLGERDISELEQLPEIENPKIKVAISLLLSMQPVGYFYKLDVWALAIVKCARLLMTYGNTAEAAPAYSQYGIYLNLHSEEFRTGYKFGRLGVNLSERYFNKSHQSMTYFAFGLCLSPWVKPAKISNNLALKGYNSGLEYGNLQWAGYNLAYRLFMLIFAGDHIQDTLKASEVCLAFGEKRQDQVVIDMARSCQKLLSQLDAVEFPETETEAEGQEEANFIATMAYTPQYLILKSQILYLQNQSQKALEYAIEAKSVVRSIQGNISVVEHNFYYSLSLLALHQPGSIDVNSSDWQQAIANQEQMKIWADNCQENFLHRYLIVAAEMARVSGQILEAIELYDRAISEAKSNEYIQNEAIANELAAKFYLDWGKEKIACTYMQEAYYCYAQWGAKAKTDDLEKRYPQLLSPILQRQQLRWSAKDTRANLTKGTVSQTNTSTGELLDLGSMMKASRSLSQEIDLEGAIAKFMQVIQENAGAETVVLMLFREEILILEAKIADGKTLPIESIPVEDSLEVPWAIVNTVKHTRTSLILDNGAGETDYVRDRYIKANQPRSILCLPLLERGRFIGIVYLENNQTIGAFTADRIEVLELLCAQAAITLENAYLYQQAQQTIQLERELHDLQRTQLTLIQSEKMFSLGQMVAGIAHEINNPIGFIHGNITHANEYMEEVLELLTLYQSSYPQPLPEIEIAIESMDLEFLRSDFEKLLKSMRNGSERIKNIVTSLRNFARLDESEFKYVDLHEGIESTLTVLQNRLQKQEKRAEIQVVKDYGKLPLVECYAGQLNQVFLNILNNAIDALEECSRQDSLTLRIGTEINEKQVKITIADNGAGMSEETQKRLFDPFFTTKEVGKGTGLGLAIAHQIITEKHGGKITCDSTVGQGTIFTLVIPR